ncbi:unnamed protein product [Sphenostylis stenocarpa]|uniref:Uncharacterized protein n=1 Tax=Sphenostylis stenocarpa TaxID=92480 RepID=A0AA86VXM9_9FABA|nr:unnamed protein product [Sphenostylis stenocarpa]
MEGEVEAKANGIMRCEAIRREESLEEQPCHVTRHQNQMKVVLCYYLCKICMQIL